MPLAFGVASDFQNLFITAPAGTVFTQVLFASYGTSPNFYSLGWCHLGSSQTRAEQLLIGQSGTVVIYVSPGNMGGDPCYGTVKTFRVVARYAPATTSLAFSTIRNNFFNTVAFDGFNWGTNDANLYNLNYYRGRLYRNSGNIFRVPSGTVSFSDFYNSDGNCVCDCLCDCACDCGGGTCFLGDALVTMADGSKKRIDQVRVGDIVDGGFGYKNEVLAYHVGELASNKLFVINGTHKTTPEHRHWTTDGWAALDVGKATTDYTTMVTVDNDGTQAPRLNKRFKNTPVATLKEGMTLVTENGDLEKIKSIVEDTTYDKSTLVYTLIVGGSHSHIANGKIVSGWAHDEDFDYSVWKPR